MSNDEVVTCEVCGCQYLAKELTRRFIPPTKPGTRGEWRNSCRMCVMCSRSNLWMGCLNDKQRAALAEVGLFASYFGAIVEKWEVDEHTTLEFSSLDVLTVRNGIPRQLLPVLAKVAKLGSWKEEHERKRRFIKER